VFARQELCVVDDDVREMLTMTGERAPFNMEFLVHNKELARWG
jgi:hypothetical protein